MVAEELAKRRRTHLMKRLLVRACVEAFAFVVADLTACPSRGRGRGGMNAGLPSRCARAVVAGNPL